MNNLDLFSLSRVSKVKDMSKPSLGTSWECHLAQTQEEEVVEGAGTCDRAPTSWILISPIDILNLQISRVPLFQECVTCSEPEISLRRVIPTIAVQGLSYSDIYAVKV